MAGTFVDLEYVVIPGNVFITRLPEPYGTRLRNLTPPVYVCTHHHGPTGELRVSRKLWREAKTLLQQQNGKGLRHRQSSKKHHRRG